LHNDAGKRTGTVVLGRVKLFHVRSDLINDWLIDTDKLQPVSRLGGITYGRTTSVYETPRPVFAKEKERDEVKKLLAKV
jgi:flavin reductase (DIM6/NTAB) family NADH-FMN oxidoreductase RutF